MAERYDVRMTSRAMRDLDGIYTYIAETLSEPGTALHMAEEIEQGILALDRHPDRCPIRKTGTYAGKGYRQLFVKNYTVIFRVDEAKKRVIVLTIRYTASKFRTGTTRSY